MFSQQGQKPFSVGTATQQPQGQQQQGQSFSFGQPQQQQAAPTQPQASFSFGAQSKPFSFGAPSTFSSYAQPATSSDTTNSFQLNRPSQSSAFSSQYSQQQPPPPISGNTLPSFSQTTVTAVPFPKETKFSDLPDQMRTGLESIHGLIATFLDQSTLLSSKIQCLNPSEMRGGAGPQPSTLNNETIEITRNIQNFENHLVACESANESCQGHLVNAKRILNRFWKYGEGVARALLNAKQVSADGKTVKWNVPSHGQCTDLNLLDEIAGRLVDESDELLGNARVLARQLDILYKSPPIHPQSICNVMSQQHQTLLNLAFRLASLEDELSHYRKEYKMLLRKHKGDIRDPFTPNTTTNKASH